MAKQSQESKRSKIGRRAEVFSGSVDADFDAKASWKDVKLMVSPEEMSGKLKLVARHGPDIKTQAALLTNGERDPFAISGLLALSHWLASRIIQGPKVRSGLRRLVQWEVSELAGKSLEEKVRGFLSLEERLRALPMVNPGKSGPRYLGDWIPESLLMRSGSSALNLKLTQAPPQSLDRMSPWTEIQLLNPQASSGDGTPGSGLTPILKGCTPCRPDPTSSKGGSKLCADANGDDLVECRYPLPDPPPTPEPVWEYFVQAANYWWTTIIGLYHAHGSTKTIKTSSFPNVQAPWDVPWLSVRVVDPFEGGCFQNICYGGCGSYETAENAHEVSAGYTLPAYLFGEYGVESDHHAGGLHAYYCGDWHWV